MTKQSVRTSSAPTPAGAYSQGVVANGVLYTSGFGPQDPATGVIAGDTVEEQTEQVLRNVRAVLAEQGLGLDDVVRSTAHLQDPHRDFAAFDAAYRRFFAEPRPARTTVGSTLNGILVEIDVVATLRDD